MATDAVGLDPNCSSAYRLANLLDGPIRTGQGWMSGEEFEPGRCDARSASRVAKAREVAGTAILQPAVGRGSPDRNRRKRTWETSGSPHSRSRWRLSCRCCRLLALGVRRSSSLRRIRDSSCEGLCILRDPIADWASRGINVLRSEMTDLSRSLCSSTSFHNEARRIETNLLDKSIDQYLRSID